MARGSCDFGTVCHSDGSCGISTSKFISDSSRNASHFIANILLLVKWKYTINFKFLQILVLSGELMYKLSFKPIVRLRAELKCRTMMNGEQFATIIGTLIMHMLFAEVLVILQHVITTQEPDMGKEWDMYGWTRSIVLALNQRLQTAQIHKDGEITYVLTVKMQE